MKLKLVGLLLLVGIVLAFTTPSLTNYSKFVSFNFNKGWSEMKSGQLHYYLFFSTYKSEGFKLSEWSNDRMYPVEYYHIGIFKNFFELNVSKREKQDSLIAVNEVEAKKEMDMAYKKALQDSIAMAEAAREKFEQDSIVVAMKGMKK